MRVLARPVGRDHTGVQAGVKAVVLQPVPRFRWSKGAVPFFGGRDGPRIAPEHHRSPQMTKECFKMHFSRNSLLTFRNSQFAKHSYFFCSKLGLKRFLRAENCARAHTRHRAAVPARRAAHRFHGQVVGKIAWRRTPQTLLVVISKIQYEYSRNT